MLCHDEQHIHTANDKLWSLNLSSTVMAFSVVQFIETNNISHFSKCLKMTYAYSQQSPLVAVGLMILDFDKGDHFSVSYRQSTLSFTHDHNCNFNPNHNFSVTSYKYDMVAWYWYRGFQRKQLSCPPNSDVMDGFGGMKHAFYFFDYQSWNVHFDGDSNWIGTQQVTLNVFLSSWKKCRKPQAIEVDEAQWRKLEVPKKVSYATSS